MASLALHAAAAGTAFALSLSAGAPSLPAAGPAIEISVVPAASLPVQRAAVPPAPAEPIPPIPEPVPVAEPSPPDPVPEPVLDVVKGVEEIPLAIAKPEPPPKSAERKAAERKPKLAPKTVPQHALQAAREPAPDHAPEHALQSAPQPAPTTREGPEGGAQLAAAPAAGRVGPAAADVSPGRGDQVILDPSYAEPPRPPVYPDRAIQLSQQGQVVIRAAIDASGRPAEVIVWQSSGHELLDRAAVQAVKKWRFVPARRGGAEIAAWVQVPVNFQLKTR